MNEPSLEGCWLKLARAKEQRAELDRELRPVLDLIRETVLTETLYDKEAAEFNIFVAYAPELPARLAIIVGDIVHNLRTALDYAVYQAVWKRRGKPWKRTQFPLVSSPRCFAKSDLVLFKKLGPDLSAIVKRHQPFEDVGVYVSEGLAATLQEAWYIRKENSALEVLRDLSNIDKHRLLLARWAQGRDMSFAVAGKTDCDPTPRFWNTDGPLHKGTHLATFVANATGANPEMEVHLNLTPSAGIGSAVDSPKLLDYIAAKVMRVIREFEPLF